MYAHVRHTQFLRQKLSKTRPDQMRLLVFDAVVGPMTIPLGLPCGSLNLISRWHGPVNQSSLGMVNVKKAT